MVSYNYNVYRAVKIAFCTIRHCQENPKVANTFVVLAKWQTSTSSTVI